MIAPFRIDLLDANQDKISQADGPIMTATQLTTVDRLDAIGEVEFTLPASDWRVNLLQYGQYFDIYAQDDPDGNPKYLGQFEYSGRSFSGAEWVVRAWNALRELTYRSVHFSRSYENVDVKAVVVDLILDVPGWSTEVDSGIGNTTVTYEGESVLIAVDVLRDRWNQHYRLKGPKTLQFGAFGEDSGVLLTNLPGQVPPDIAAQKHVAIIPEGGLNLVEEVDEVYNRVIPLAGDVGVNLITIENATAGSYSVQQGMNDDGSAFWYIEDSTSVNAYGLRERVMKFDIRPVSNSQQALDHVANTIKQSAEAIMSRHLTPKVTYGVSVVGLRHALLPGDTVRLTYRGVVERLDGQGRFAFVDVDEDVYVMDVNTTRKADGQRAVRLTVSTTAQRRTADTDVMIEVIHDLRAQRLHVRPNSTKVLYGPYTRRIDSTNSAIFTVSLGEEVLQVTFAYLMIRSSPLKSSVVTAEVAGDHRHRMWQYVDDDLDPNHDSLDFVRCMVDEEGSDAVWIRMEVPTGEDLYTHGAGGSHSHDLNYGIYADTEYPTGMGVKINGVDQTAALGGPWAPGGGAVTIKVEITDIIAGASGGLQQDHTIEVYCASAQGEVEVGVLTMETIQAIVIG